MASHAAAVSPDSGAETALAPAPRKSSFYLALRLLSPAQRQAMYAVYAFCRAVDDIADSEGPRGERLAALAKWREAIEALYAGHLPSPDLAPLKDAIARYRLEKADCHALIDGMAMDVETTILAPDRTTLDLYVDRVASAPGRLSVRVFGLPGEEGTRLAHHLGRALQLTNILRDVDEDAERGRLYLPREDLAAAGITETKVAPVLAHPRLTEACTAIAQRAAHDFKMAGTIMDDAPRRAVRAPRLMAAAYGPVLDRLLARGWAPPREPVRKSKSALLGAMLRYAFF